MATALELRLGLLKKMENYLNGINVCECKCRAIAVKVKRQKKVGDGQKNSIRGKWLKRKRNILSEFSEGITGLIFTLHGTDGAGSSYNQQRVDKTNAKIRSVRDTLR